MTTTSEFVRIRNNNFAVTLLQSTYPIVRNLVEEYFLDQNCWPDCWINDVELTEKIGHSIETQRATFIYYCLTDKRYTYNPFGGW